MMEVILTCTTTRYSQCDCLTNGLLFLRSLTLILLLKKRHLLINVKKQTKDLGLLKKSTETRKFIAQQSLLNQGTLQHFNDTQKAHCYPSIGALASSPGRSKQSSIEVRSVSDLDRRAMRNDCDNPARRTND